MNRDSSHINLFGRPDYVGLIIHAVLIVWIAFIVTYYQHSFVLGLEMAESVSIKPQQLVDRSYWAMLAMWVTMPAGLFIFGIAALFSLASVIANVKSSRHARAILDGFMPIALWIMLFSVLKTTAPDYNAAMLSAINRVDERGAPVIDAITRYHADEGEYPPDIESLVPDYLESIPSPGIAACDAFDYRRVGQSWDYMPTDSYTLVVPLAYRIVPLDVFFYTPDERNSMEIQGSDTDWKWWVVH